jgi:hypothetical protein
MLQHSRSQAADARGHERVAHEGRRAREHRVQRHAERPAMTAEKKTSTEHEDAMQDQSQDPGRIAARHARTTRLPPRPRRRRRRCTPARCRRACRACARLTKTRLRPRPRRRGCRRSRGPPRWATATRAWPARLACPSPQQQPPHYLLPASSITPHTQYTCTFEAKHQMLQMTPTHSTSAQSKHMHAPG